MATGASLPATVSMLKTNHASEVALRGWAFRRAASFSETGLSVISTVVLLLVSLLVCWGVWLLWIVCRLCRCFWCGCCGVLGLCRGAVTRIWLWTCGINLIKLYSCIHSSSRISTVSTRGQGQPKTEYNCNYSILLGELYFATAFTFWS